MHYTTKHRKNPAPEKICPACGRSYRAAWGWLITQSKSGLRRFDRLLARALAQAANGLDYSESIRAAQEIAEEGGDL